MVASQPLPAQKGKVSAHSSEHQARLSQQPRSRSSSILRMVLMVNTSTAHPERLRQFLRNINQRSPYFQQSENETSAHLLALSSCVAVTMWSSRAVRVQKPEAAIAHLHTLTLASTRSANLLFVAFSPVQPSLSAPGLTVGCHIARYRSGPNTRRGNTTIQSSDYDFSRSKEHIPNMREPDEATCNRHEVLVRLT